MKYRIAVVLSLVAATWMAGLASLAAEFKLSMVGIDSQRRPTLSLEGLLSGRYVVEASTNLTHWFSLASVPSGSESWNFLHDDAAEMGTVFYRGVKLPEISTVAAQVDSNHVAVGLVTIESGGTLALTNESGVSFKFTVGPSNVLDTVAIRMQLVTNFTSFPYENEMRTAVLFEPSGFEFHGAGLLEITFPTNVPHLKLSSFAFAGDGGGFHLTPDVVATNRVKIPVTHFSGVGTGLWAPSERTKAVTSFVENTLDRMSQDVAGITGHERDQQLLGAEPDPNIGGEITRRQQDYYDNYLKPYFAEAEKDCALAKFLTRQVLGLERSSQLLSGEEGPGAGSSLGSPTFQKWACNCQSEAIKACEEGKISDRTLIRTLVGFERSAQLLGGGKVLESCGLGSIEDFMGQALTNKLPCAPEWIGTMNYSDGGDRSWDCSGDLPGIRCTASTATALNFEAEVETVEFEDESFPPFFSRQNWTIRLFPEANGTFSSETESIQKLDCGSTITKTSRKTGANAGPLDLEVKFTFENGELTEFTIHTDVGGDLDVKTVEIATTNISPCDKGGTGSSFSQTFKDSAFLSPQPVTMDEVMFTKRTPTAIEGTVIGMGGGLDEILMPYTWKFSFHRNGN